MRTYLSPAALLLVVASACTANLGPSSDFEGGSDTLGSGGQGGASSCPAGTALPDCKACASGTYCAGGDAEAKPCAAGTYDHDQKASTRCEAWTHCDAGEYVLTPG